MKTNVSGAVNTINPTDKAQKALCLRCGKPFIPKPTKLKTIKLTRHCETCQCRNLFDALDMPTPPELLDKYTKHPTLTEKEYYRKLKEVKEVKEKDKDE